MDKDRPVILTEEYQLFLFDFDGLLVNTEHLHWEAYRQVCGRYGYDLRWDFPQFCDACHRSADGPQKAIYGLFPELKEREPDWSVIYEQKSAIYVKLLESGRVELLPGVEELLQKLESQAAKRAVVTHSRAQFIDLIRKQHPILNTIPHWFTREDYTEPKPSPECYQTAIDRLADASDRIIGFEDTPRGLQSLRGTRAQSVIVCADNYPLLPETLDEETVHLTSFLGIMNDE